MPKKGTIVEADKKYETDKQLARYWCAIFYPEGAVDNWIQKLDDMGVACSVSPLHDQDLKEDGTTKKPHHHIILCYDGNRSGFTVRMQLQELLRDGNEMPMVQKCESVEGSEKYQTHEGQNEKHHYEEKPIHLNGYDPAKYQQTEKKKTKEENDEKEDEAMISIMMIIEENHISELWQLMKYLVSNNKDLVKYVRKKAFLYQSLLTSKREEERQILERERTRAISSGIETDRRGLQELKKQISAIESQMVFS